MKLNVKEAAAVLAAGFHVKLNERDGFEEPNQPFAAELGGEEMAFIGDIAEGRNTEAPLVKLIAENIDIRAGFKSVARGLGFNCRPFSRPRP